jgi:glycerate 2-kinase
LVERHLHGLSAPFDRALGIVGAGKAAARMAAGVEAVRGTAQLVGRVVVPAGCEAPLERVRISFGSHPVPDELSQRAGSELFESLDRIPAGWPLLCLISGGASSLLVQPRPPLQLADKMAVTRLLLECGAEIAELNTVRKHLSTVKGGGLAQRAGDRAILTLALSDVVGDDPSIIGSGPAVGDPTTFVDALAVLDRYALRARVSAKVRVLLERGAAGEVPETLKPDAPQAEQLSSAVIGSNRIALEGAAVAAARLGYLPIVQSEPMVGDSAQAGRRWGAYLAGLPAEGRWCAIAGGETTVVVRGQGRGGRNQEFAVALAESLAGQPIAALSAGTDGIDGPTDAAGAFVDGDSRDRAAALGLSAEAALATNDSYAYFDPLADLLRCGPTGTNVMDIKLALRVGSSP